MARHSWENTAGRTFRRAAATAVSTFFVLLPAAVLAQQPTLSIPIPNVKLSGLVKSGSAYVMPFIGEYTLGVYEYAAGVAMVLAGVMFVIGGFQYLTAGADSQRVGNAKSRIIDSAVGALLVLGSYVLLATIDPALTKTTDIAVPRVEPGSLAQIVSYGSGVPEEEVKTWDTTPAPPTVVGAPVKDEVGNYVAQGACPSDMVPIPESQDYFAKTSKKVEAFCIDRYEEPNGAGKRPFIGVTEWEADWYCTASGKRLCTDEEWKRACLGPKGENVYGYGPEFITGQYVAYKSGGPKTDSGGHTYYNAGVKSTGKPKGPCNYDSNAISPFNPIGTVDGFPTGKTEQDGFLYNFTNPDSPKLKDPKYKEKFDKVVKILANAGVEPSGTRSTCKTAEGVYDMIGNTQEIVAKAGAPKTTEARIAKGTAPSGKPYTWMNGYWSPVWHLANPDAKPTCTSTAGGPHAVNWRGHENGFRCCLNLNAGAK